MALPRKTQSPARVFVRAVLEITSILFLFYANLLMGEFERSNGRGKTLAFALHDICTKQNLLIALIAATAGFVVFETLRNLLKN
jgi:hypothetical protein